MKDETKFIKKYFSLSYFGNTLANTMLSSCFVLFFTIYKGFTAVQISLILGLTPIVALPTFFVWGAIIDKSKKLILFNKLVNAGNIITLLAFFFVNSFIGIFILNIIRNIIMQPNSTLNEEYLMILSRRPNVVFGKIRVFSTIGYGISGIFVPIILSVVDVAKGLMAGIFVIFLNLCILAFLPEITDKSGNDILVKEFDDNAVQNVDNEVAISEKSSPVSRVQSIGSILELLKNKEFIRYSFIYSVAMGTLSAASTYGAQIIMIDLGASNILTTMMPLFLVFFEIFILVFGNRYIKFENPFRILTIALLILSLRWVFMINISSYLIMLLLTLIHGIVTGLVIPIHNDIIGKVIPTNQVSTAFLVAGILAFTILPGALNIINGYTVDVLGLNSFAYSYLILTILALILVIPKTIEEIRSHV